MKKHLLVLGVSVGMLCYGAGCSKSSSRQSSDSPSASDTVAVKVSTINPQTFSVQGEYYGTVTGIEEATILSLAGGTVEQLGVREGQSVKQGQSLGKIDAARAEVALETARLNEQIALESYNRTQTYFEQGNAAQLAVDQTKLAWLNSKRQTIEAEKVWKGALCIAPLSGTVLSRFVRMHQELPPGSPVYAIADTRRMSVMVGIPESELGGVGEGSTARVSVSVMGTRVWEATVRRLSREIAKSNRVAQAELVIDNPDGAIKAGMTARVNLTRVSYDNALVVPTDAIRSQAGESYLMVAQQGKALRRTVRLGVSDQRFTVVEEGVEPGMQIIVEGHHLVNDGTPLTIHN